MALGCVRKLVYVVLVALLASGISYFFSDFFNAIDDCTDEPTARCLVAAVENYDYSGIKNQDRLLSEAGLFEKAIETIDRDSSLASRNAISYVSAAVAEQAMSEPEILAGQSELKELLDAKSLPGIIANYDLSPEQIEASYYFYLNLHMLYPRGVSGFSGSYINELVYKRFKPNITWTHAIKKRIEIASDNPNWPAPLISIANQLYYAGQRDDAYQLISGLEPQNESMLRNQSKLLDKLDKTDKAQELRDKFGKRQEGGIKRLQNSQGKEFQSTAAILIQQIVDSPAPPDSYSEKVKRMRKVSLIAYHKGEQRLAIQTAELALELDKKKTVRFPVSAVLEKSAHYRAIGEPEKAMTSMKELFETPKSRCSPFVPLERIAMEFYHLGRLDLTAKRIAEYCESSSVFSTMFGYKSVKLDKEQNQKSTWRRIYTDAVINAKNTEVIIQYAGVGVVSESIPFIVEHYMNQGEFELATEWSLKALELGLASHKLVTAAGILGDNKLLKLQLANQIKKADGVSGKEKAIQYLQILSNYEKAKVLMQ